MSLMFCSFQCSFIDVVNVTCRLGFTGSTLVCSKSWLLNLKTVIHGSDIPPTGGTPLHHGNPLVGNSLRGVYSPYDKLLQPSILEVMHNDVWINIH